MSVAILQTFHNMEKKITTANKVKSSSQRSLGFVHSLKGKMNVVVSLMLLFFVGIVFSSCDKDDALMSPMGEEQLFEKSQLRSLSVTNSNDIVQKKGWTLIEDLGADYGYKLYSKGGDFVQKLNLSAGAKIAFGFGIMSQNPDNQASPLFKRLPLSGFWNVRPRNTLSVVNCSFFWFNNQDQSQESCLLSFPIKTGGILKTTGSSNSQSDKRQLILFKSYAEIKTFDVFSNDENLINRNLKGSSVICAFSPDATISSWAKTWVPVGRTMIGLVDQNHDGKKEVLYILTGSFLQGKAKSVLMSCGCSSDDIIMLDGSKSAQMYMRNPKSGATHQFQYDARTIPNVLYVTH